MKAGQLLLLALCLSSVAAVVGAEFDSWEPRDLAAHGVDPASSLTLTSSERRSRRRLERKRERKRAKRKLEKEERQRMKEERKRERKRSRRRRKERKRKKMEEKAQRKFLLDSTSEFPPGISEETGNSQGTFGDPVSEGVSQGEAAAGGNWTERLFKSPTGSGKGPVGYTFGRKTFLILPPQHGYSNQPASNPKWLSANLTHLWKTVRALQVRLATMKKKRTPRKRNSRKNVHKFEHVQLKTPHIGACTNNWNPSNVSNCLDEEGEICGRKGTCDCGFCNCKRPHYGLKCQCSDHTCPRENGILCGGPSQGQCRCGKCICQEDYTGDACECYSGFDHCLSPGSSGEICSRHGHCKCGNCICGEGYRGKYCEEAVYAAGVCQRLKQCVTCELGRKLPSCQYCDLKIVRTESVESGLKTCVMVSYGCLLRYTYELLGDGVYQVLIPRNLTCDFTTANGNPKVGNGH